EPIEELNTVGAALRLGHGHRLEDIELHHVIERLADIPLGGEMNERILEFGEVRSQKVCLAAFQLIPQLDEPSPQTEARVVDDLHHLAAQLQIIGKQVQGLEGGADDGKIVQPVFQTGIG